MIAPVANQSSNRSHLPTSNVSRPTPNSLPKHPTTVQKANSELYAHSQNNSAQRSHTAHEIKALKSTLSTDSIDRMAYREINMDDITDPAIIKFMEQREQRKRQLREESLRLAMKAEANRIGVEIEHFDHNFEELKQQRDLQEAEKRGRARAMGSESQSISLTKQKTNRFFKIPSFLGKSEGNAQLNTPKIEQEKEKDTTSKALSETRPKEINTPGSPTKPLSRTVSRDRVELQKQGSFTGVKIMSAEGGIAYSAKPDIPRNNSSSEMTHERGRGDSVTQGILSDDESLNNNGIVIGTTSVPHHYPQVAPIPNYNYPYYPPGYSYPISMAGQVPAPGQNHIPGQIPVPGLMQMPLQMPVQMPMSGYHNQDASSGQVLVPGQQAGQPQMMAVYYVPMPSSHGEPMPAPYPYMIPQSFPGQYPTMDRVDSKNEYERGKENNQEVLPRGMPHPAHGMTHPFMMGQVPYNPYPYHPYPPNPPAFSTPTLQPDSGPKKVMSSRMNTPTSEISGTSYNYSGSSVGDISNMEANVSPDSIITPRETDSRIDRNDSHGDREDRKRERRHRRKKSDSHITGWSCPVCTLVNKSSYLACDACGALKERKSSRN